MKETKIAKKNVEKWANSVKPIEVVEAQSIQETHKQTCQRWLEFLDEWFEIDSMDNLKECNCDGCKFARDKIKDLKQAIKIYEEVGI